MSGTVFDWTMLSRLVPEVAMIAVFVWFTLERDKRYDARAAELDKQRAEERATRDQSWRDFLSQLRDANEKALSRIGDEIRAVVVQTSATNALLIAHDKQASTFIARYEGS